MFCLPSLPSRPPFREECVCSDDLSRAESPCPAAGLTERVFLNFSGLPISSCVRKKSSSSLLKDLIRIPLFSARIDFVSSRLLSSPCVYSGLSAFLRSYSKQVVFRQSLAYRVAFLFLFNKPRGHPFLPRSR